MKILLYNDFRTLVGGTERYIQNLLPLLEQEADVQLLTAEDVLPIATYSTAQKYFSFWSENNLLNQYLSKAITTFKPDVIHLNNVYFYTQSVLDTLRCYHIPVLMTMHDCRYCHLTTDSPLQYLFKVLKKQTISSTIQIFLAPSQAMYDLANAQYTQKIDLLPLFIDSQKWRFGTPNYQGTLRLLYIGNLDSKKGVFMLLDVLQRLHQCNIKATLTFIGVGVDERALQATIHDRNLEYCVDLLGKVQDTTIQYFMQSHFALLYPSLLHESFGMSGLEAQASGLPVVASNIGGITEWAIHEKTALLAKPNDVEDWYHKILLLWNNQNLYNQIRHEAHKQSITKFLPSQHIKHIMSNYSNLSKQKIDIC